MARIENVNTNCKDTLYIVVNEYYWKHYWKKAYFEPQALIPNDYAYAKHLATKFALTDLCDYIVIKFDKTRKKWIEVK